MKINQGKYYKPNLKLIKNDYRANIIFIEELGFSKDKAQKCLFVVEDGIYYGVHFQNQKKFNSETKYKYRIWWVVKEMLEKNLIEQENLFQEEMDV